ncbi:hypothetical protein CHUAL_001278 [Chamberlinius hualienensis]
MRISFSSLNSLTSSIKRIHISITGGLIFSARSHCATIYLCQLKPVRRYSTQLQCKMVKKAFERLPKNVSPKHYNIRITPDFEKFTFQGEVTVDVEVVEATPTILLNAIELTFDSASFTPENEAELTATVALSEEDETATFNFPSTLRPGKGSLKLKYAGILNDMMRGFYRSKYTTANGETRYSGCTQFESTDARRAFPCWDEPAIKATFDMTLVTAKNLVTLSNMDPVRETELTGNLKEVKFATTPIMSTYLVAIVIGEYDYVEDVSDGNIRVRVYTPVGKKEQGRYALNVATKVLPYYRDYFNVEYPLPKLDMVAIPDFAMGAMENWGLVTYRENCLLVDPVNSSSLRTQTVALVVGHELAHQWFGNIVTMEWWTHLWLNEGFASWIEFLCVDYLFPEYDIWTQFASDSLLPPLELDALRSSHPIEVAVGHPSEVDEIFDNISYGKGACVIRMLHNYIGDEDFRKGMHQYLTKHKYGNTFTEDLWDALGKACNKPVGEMMSTWTQQMGYPVIKVDAKQVENGRLLTLTQRRYFAEGPVEGDNSLWVVPISFSTSSNPEKVVKKTVLYNTATEIVIENLKPNEWVKLNPGAVGFYRCLYSDEIMESFLPNIRDKSLPPLDRLGLQNDLFAMVTSGQKSMVDYLKLLEAYVDEDNYTVWCSIGSSLSRLFTVLSHTDYYELLESFGRQLLAKVAEKVGWNPQKDEGHSIALLRPLILGRLGAYGDESVRNEARRRFDTHVNKTAILPADLRSPVYSTVVSIGDQKTIDAAITLYREADLQEEKSRLLGALGSPKDVSLLRNVIDFAMSDDVRSQDTITILASIGRNRFGRDLAWQFFKDNKDVFVKRYGSGYLLTLIIKYVTEGFASEEKAKEVESYFHENPLAGTERVVLQSLETIRLNARLLARDSAAVKTWLNSRS